MISPPACQGGASYVYLLRSQTTGNYYVGWTTDLQRRLEGHAAGKATYTRSRGPWKLIGWEQFATSETAKERERTLKRNPRMLTLFKNVSAWLKSPEMIPGRWWDDHP